MNPRLHTPFPAGSSSPPPGLTFPNQQQLNHYEPIARVYAAFIEELFQSEQPGSDPFFTPNTFTSLPFFIAYALSQSPLDSPMVAIATLSLLYRYKSRISQRQAKLRDPSRLFLTAYLVAAKLLSDKAYPMRTWASLGQNNYSAHELAIMEWEFCFTLNWDLNLNAELLNSFRIIVEVFLSTMGLPRLYESHSGRTPPLDQLLSSPDTPELAWSPRSNSSFWLASPVTNENWEWVEREIEETRSMVEEVNYRIFELEAEFDALLHEASPQAPEPTKVSVTKRISKLLQVRFKKN
ncbi:hypothetical protein D9756_009240 [Leucocoprinus leucothites]|uniref:Cyclin N-terminal domain-containing protein n=1 Tax=Leucocoprinus leucothites TaxID=201217 RepID=A0A8H5CZH8_9AGAR|nr:hypothetical protein D9756_009240 [Leucoagaricus leucothites]